MSKHIDKEEEKVISEQEELKAEETEDQTPQEPVEIGRAHV